MKTLIISDETYKFVTHCMMACQRTGGGSYLATALREIVAPEPMETDYNLLMMLCGNVILEASDQLEEAEAETFKRLGRKAGMTFAHPYEVR